MDSIREENTWVSIFCEKYLQSKEKKKDIREIEKEKKNRNRNKSSEIFYFVPAKRNLLFIY